MKIILLKDVPHLGQKGDIKEVKEGFGRNFLLARGLAKIAGPIAERDAENMKKKREEKNKAELSVFEKALQKIAGAEIKIEANANEQGRLFRAISVKQILAALKKAGIEEVEETDIQVKEPVKSIGEHEIELSREKIIGKIKIVVRGKEDKGEKGVKGEIKKGGNG